MTVKNDIINDPCNYACIFNLSLLCLQHFHLITLNTTLHISDLFNCGFIETVRGTKLLMVNGYTFSQNNRAKKFYYCSKRKYSCMSSVKFDDNGAIVSVTENHTHPPPVYKKLENGLYVLIRWSYYYVMLICLRSIVDDWNDCIIQSQYLRRPVIEASRLWGSS